MLSVKERQKRLKELGFYDGNVDGIVGAKTKSAYTALQKAYFSRPKYIDGKYGKNTDILLQSAYNVHKQCKNFKLHELKCKCGGRYCTGYPAVISPKLISNLQKVRDKFGATVITSGLRCPKHNSAVGGSLLSRHKSGKACDIQNASSKSNAGRSTIMDFWKTLPDNRYTYCNVAKMGNTVHIDVK